MLHIYVDADACPVKDEVFRVAGRHRLPTTLVSNSRMRIPFDDLISLEVVGSGLDVADDWIADQAGLGDIVITADILLAGRCLPQGVRVLGPTGRPFTEDNIGDAVATRELLAELRSGGERTGGPAPIDKRDRSRFLQELDNLIGSIRRQHPDAEPSRK